MIALVVHLFPPYTSSWLGYGGGDTIGPIVSTFQELGLQQVALRRLHPTRPMQWSLHQSYDRGPAWSHVEFRSLQHLADELQGPCAEFGWRCELSADQQTVLLSR